MQIRAAIIENYIFAHMLSNNDGDGGCSLIAA